ncbi:hypothetical protein KY285_001011 [Solanum tuberosum]|nr:hypothetical protein KY285_001011 [Solanum tuberosum]
MTKILQIFLTLPMMQELLDATTIKRARLDDQQLVVFNEDDMVDVAGVMVIPSKNVWDPYTSQAKRRKKSFIKAIQNLKKKTFGKLPMAVGEKLMEFKHVNLYRHVPIAQKNKLVELMRGKDLRVQHGMEFFSGDDFSTMTSTNIWWEDWYNDEILSLMRERNLRSPEYYDSTNRILNLNFYTNFKKNMTNYVRGIRPYPGGKDWIGAKRILAVINMKKTHFVTLEILLHEGHMKGS